jgi:hypothetical protein
MGGFPFMEKSYILLVFITDIMGRVGSLLNPNKGMSTIIRALFKEVTFHKILLILLIFL